MAGCFHPEGSETMAQPMPTTRTMVQTAAQVVGAVFVFVGVVGFLPADTTHYELLDWAGPDSGAKLLGLFQVSILHNIVHLIVGVVGIAAARTVGTARAFLIGGGILFLFSGIYGLVIDLDNSANFIPLNTADNCLHLGLGVSMIVLGRHAARIFPHLLRQPHRPSTGFAPMAAPCW
jgi:hypothetical protein